MRNGAPPREPGEGHTSKLAAAHLRKRYKARTVVHDVSLEVASGEVVGLLGPAVPLKRATCRSSMLCSS